MVSASAGPDLRITAARAVPGFRSRKGVWGRTRVAPLNEAAARGSRRADF